MRLINALEASGQPDRALEFLPSDEALAERANIGKGLTRPELSVLISYSKIELKKALLDSRVPDDDYLAREMETAFPQQLVERFRGAMLQHRLKREIVSTQIANDLVNMGITFVQRLHEATGMSAANVAGAYVIVRDIFHLPHWFRQIEALDHKVPAELQLSLMDELMRLGRRATRWFLRNRRSELMPRGCSAFRSAGCSLGIEAGRAVARLDPRPLAGALSALHRSWRARAAGAHGCRHEPSVHAAADPRGRRRNRAGSGARGRGVFRRRRGVELPWYLHQLTNMPVSNNWQAMAREGFRDDLDSQQRSITVSVLQMDNGPESIGERVDSWLALRPAPLERWRSMLAELRSASGNDYAIYAVASRGAAGAGAIGRHG